MNDELTPIKSSNLEAAGYSAAKQTLVVQFKGGGKYKYPNVSDSLWQEFAATFDGTNGKSAGTFFHARLRHLPCEKIKE